MARSGAAYRYAAYRRRRRNGHGAPRMLIAFGSLAGLLIIAIAIVAGISYTVYNSYADELVPPDEAIAKLPRGGARILDRDGELLYEFLDDASGLRDPVSIDNISLWLVLATVATEDSSFFDNPGVNYKGLLAAAWDNFSPFGATPGFLEGRGGSSITQQLVKNVYFTQEERGERSVERKLKETVYALELTQRYSKRQIMEWYLNQISYGNVFIGVEAAANGYFGKDANDLSIAEAAMLAAIPACPSCYDPINEPAAALAQRNIVLRRMYEEHYLTGEQLWNAASDPLEIKPQRFPIQAPHFVFNVVEPELRRLFGEEALRRDGLVVTTTIELDAQRQAQDILESYIQQYEATADGHNGAAVGIDPKTAEIIVYIGSRDYFRDDINGQNDMAQALNSPGSSFKPFTYLTAFMNLGWGPGTLILDSAISSKYWDGANPPRNPVAHSGPITARDALGNSLNIPAVKTILYTGVPEVIAQAKKVGITSLDGRDLGPSMTVGGVDIELLDMVYGYTVFPNLGVLKGVESTVDRPEGNRTTDPVAILRVEDRDGNVLYPKLNDQPLDRPVLQEVQVAPPEDAYMINSILSDPNAHCITYGCGGLTIPGRPIGMKTGTSEPYEQIGLIGETWTFGYTPQLVFGTWFGNADNKPMVNISSYYVSARTTRDFMIAYHEGLPVEPFARPAGLVETSVCVPSWLKPTDACPETTPPDLFAADTAATSDDTWWTVARVDTRTGKLASDDTPEEFVEERSFLNVPDGLPDFVREQALEWAKALEQEAGEAPTEVTDEDDLPSVISSPASASPVRGVVTITGRAASPGFESYRLEFHNDQSGGDWLLIAQGDAEANGTLGVWDTSTLSPGLYTIRLVVTDAERGELTTRVQVLVLSPEPVPPGEGDGGGYAPRLALFLVRRLA